jgi:sugar phosphate isomerase/epimerase
MIKYTCIVLLAFSIACSKPDKLPIGLQLYSIRTQLADDLDGSLQMLAQHGYSFVEVSGTYGHTGQALSSSLERSGLSVLSIGADYAELSKDLDSLAEWAAELGAEAVVCYWIPHEAGSFSAAHINKAAGVFNEAGKFFAQHGLSFCYHPHWYEFQQARPGFSLFDSLMLLCPPQYVKVQADIYWLGHTGQDAAVFLDKYRSRIHSIHLKDRMHGYSGSPFEPADTESNVALGRGDMQIGKIARYALSLGLDCLIVEDESSRAAEQIVQSINFLRKELY